MVIITTVLEIVQIVVGLLLSHVVLCVALLAYVGFTGSLVVRLWNVDHSVLQEDVLVFKLCFSVLNRFRDFGYTFTVLIEGIRHTTVVGVMERISVP